MESGQPRFRHRPVSFVDVDLDDGFWAPRQRTVRERTVPFFLSQCEKFGVIEALDIWSPPPPLRIPFYNRPSTPVMYYDSDLGKWIEMASYTLAKHWDDKLDAQVDDVIARIAKAQQPDGYFNSFFLRRMPEKRWTNLRDWHELYCAGHLIEAAVAHKQSTGKNSLLDIMRRYVDYIATVFGPGPGQKRGYCGHPEIELALVRLYRLTGERRYLDLSRYFIDERGRQPSYFDEEMRARGEDISAYLHGTNAHTQAAIPVREQSRVTGHAVRAMYLYCGMADIAGETGDQALLEACRNLWTDVTERRLYVTGGLGPAARNEGFTTEYDLPNDTAYAETCAAIGLIFWAHRLLQIEADSRYADVMELALYNGALSGIGLDGEQFFYDNPLASRGTHHRWTWNRCPCCPPNLGRLIAQMGEYVYSTGEDEVAVHLFVQGRAQMSVGGTGLRLVQETRYPWDGTVKISIDPEADTEFTLRLRIPGWCRSGKLAVNGASLDIEAAKERGYAQIRRRWRTGDRVQLVLDMPAERVYAHPDVRADLGRVALRRGPIVYCLEGVDHQAPVNRIVLPRGNPLDARFDAGLLDGVGIVEADAVALKSFEGGGTLYASAAPKTGPARIRAIPYCVWDHRAPGEMAVWLPEF